MDSMDKSGRWPCLRSSIVHPVHNVHEPHGLLAPLAPNRIRRPVMPPQLAPEERMTIEEFLAFTESRPDDERWELIEGVPVMQAAPTALHQTIVVNIAAVLRAEKRRLNASWHILLGVGTRVPISPQSLPQPDLMVREHSATGDHVSDDGLALFEVFSKSNTK